MEEKIKIYVPENIYAILLKDMERFEIVKKDGSINPNAFYNTLIVNYCDQYQKNNSHVYEHIESVIHKEFPDKPTIASSLAASIVQYYQTQTTQIEGLKSEIAVSIKPTKKSSPILDFVRDYYLQNTSLSNYFRNMFATYALLPQDKRERIIFKENFEAIETALSSHRKIYFTIGPSGNKHIVSPYAISNSKEELFNYLLAENRNNPFSFRISRMKHIMVLNESAEIDPFNIEIFEKMKEHGPQFAYNKEERGYIAVRFTDYGKRLYRSMYLHRPKYDYTENNIYYFSCSISQAFQYFNRFGANAKILYPAELRENLIRFYGHAYNRYRNDKEYK